jgi:type IV secretion system protein TrbL
MRSLNNRRSISRLAFLVLAMIAIAGVAAGQTPKPSALLDQYRAQRITWSTNIWPYANTLFGILATIEFAWSAAVMLLEKTDLQSWTSALVRKIMWIGAFYALLLNGRVWIPTIIDSFEKIGQTASGFNQIAPSDVFAQGIDIAGALMASSSTAAFFQNLGTSLAMVVAAALVALAFTGIAIQFIVAMVESYIIVAAGFIFLGFGGSRWTVPYTERYIGLAFSIGLKIMLLYLLIGTGMNLSNDWMTDAEKVSLSLNPAMSAFEIMGAALIFLMLCWQVPKLFAAVLGGSPALSGGDLLATATGVAAGAAMVGSFIGDSSRAVGSGVSAVSHALGAGTGANGGATTTLAGVGSSFGSGGTGNPPPPDSPSHGGPNGQPRQPNPPGGSGLGTNSGGTAAGGRNVQPPINAALASVGGEHLAGSGFERERSASGFSTSSLPVTGAETGARETGNATGALSDGHQTPSPASTGSQAPASVPRAGIASSIGNLRPAPRQRRFNIVPSDLATHAQPPRMPVDHEE